MPHDLPTELVDLILKQLHPFEDQLTLETCGFVCKSWLALSRVLLFADISLHRGNIASFCDVAERSCLVPIQSCIRRLTLEYIEEALQPSGEVSPETLGHYTELEEHLPRVGSFPGVHILRLEMNGTVLDRHAVFLGTICPNLSTLDIDAVSAGALPAVLRAVAAFPSAQTLKLRDFCAPPTNHALSPAYRFPKELRTVDLTASDADGFFRSVLALDALPVFSSLSAWNAWPHAHSALGDYLRRVGPFIQHICLDAYLHDVSDNMYATDPIAFAYCTGLQSLRISAENVPYIALKILPLLAVAAPGLGVISLESSRLYFGSCVTEDEEARCAWRRIDVLLSGDRDKFAELEVFEVIAQWNVEDATRYMPLTVARGILHFG